MIRRYPLICGFVVLLTLIIFYADFKVTAYNSVRNIWFDKVSRRMVEDRATLVQQPKNLFGMYRPELPWDYVRFFELSAELNVHPLLVSWYQAWGDHDEATFKTEAMHAAHKAGLIPMITWEPWINKFEGFDSRPLDSSLILLNKGCFDPYITRWAREAVRYGHPFMLRPLHEPGNPWYAWSTEHGNSPAVEKEAWQHIVKIFRAEGATNVAFVWTPYTVADTALWPGNEYVDWIGLDIFNYGKLVDHSSWTDMRTLLKKLRDPLQVHGKPFLVAEAGTTNGGGNSADWWSEAFHDLSQSDLQDVRGLVLFNNPAGITPTGIPVDWRMPESLEDLKRYRASLAQLHFR